jgi:hypothetical protein
VELHGAELAIASARGDGTIVTLIFPRAAETALAVAV